MNDRITLSTTPTLEGKTIEQTRVVDSGGDLTWRRPRGIGTELAVWITSAASPEGG